jgi:putative hydrolase of the HAD superfamily
MLFSPPSVTPPPVIFFDAVGTIFAVKNSVGAAYAEVTAEFGVTINPERVNQAFYDCFRQAERMAFPDVAAEAIPACEYAWWQRLAIATFCASGDFDKFTDFDEFFARLYEYFQTAAPWVVYPDTIPALQYWQSQGTKLAVLSNFDHRLYPVLEALDLAAYFDAVFISTKLGAAKPDQDIFAHGLNHYQLSENPHQAWHIGDSLREDYHGARAIGISALWLNRTGHEVSMDPAIAMIRSLEELRLA